MSNKKILIVEDEPHLAEGLKFNFEQEGYSVELAGDGPTALKHFDPDKECLFDLILLDLMLPGMSGYETSREIRQRNPAVPILVLSARTLSEDKAHAFDSGVDQYMTKPFALPELFSRVRHLIDRFDKERQPPKAQKSEIPNPFCFGDNEVDFDAFQLTTSTETVDLTTLEAAFLRYMVENEGRVLSRKEILENVWETSAEVSTRAIDNFVMRLRRRIEPDPARPQFILSVRGTGYRFVSEPENPTDD